MPTTTTFAARGSPVCGLDCAFTAVVPVGASVSSLYTFPGVGAWLGVGVDDSSAVGSVHRVYGSTTPGFLRARPNWVPCSAV